MDAVREGEVLEVAAGTYPGPLVIRNAGAKIIAKGKVIIDGNGVGTVISIDAPRVTLKGFTLRNSGRSYTQVDAGVRIKNADGAVILENTVEDCLFGIDVQGAKNILLRRNRISSKNLSIGMRGDALRLWNVKGGRVLENEWSHSRDAVSWYSENITFAFNKGTHSRYSLHSMYSTKLRIQSNTFLHNSVGIFLMYGKEFMLVDNRIEDSQGATGMGIGMKEASDIDIHNNKILYTAIALLFDSSPFAPGTPARVFGNTLAYNGKAISINNDRGGSYFRGNSFSGNMTDVFMERRGGSLGKWEGNFWDNYEGFDSDHDGWGDLPHSVMRYGEDLRQQQPLTGFFQGTPLLLVISALERFLPLSAPTLILQDKRPHLKRIEAR